MSTSEVAAHAIIDKALAELAAVIASDTGRDQPIATNWVLVSEWSTLDGERFISRDWDPRGTIWQRDGMLHHALYSNWDGSVER